MAFWRSVSYFFAPNSQIFWKSWSEEKETGNSKAFYFTTKLKTHYHNFLVELVFKNKSIQIKRHGIRFADTRILKFLGFCGIALAINVSSRLKVFCKRGLFLKNLQDSREIIWTRVSFLIKLQVSACYFIKKETLTQVFSIKLKNTYFRRIPLVAAS